MLRGFSNFEQMFRHKMAKVAPTEVLVAKKIKVISDYIKVSYHSTFYVLGRTF